MEQPPAPVSAGGLLDDGRGPLLEALPLAIHLRQRFLPGLLAADVGLHLGGELLRDTVRELAKQVAQAYYDSREALGFPMNNPPANAA